MSSCFNYSDSNSASLKQEDMINEIAPESNFTLASIMNNSKL